ncbi:MAG: hypothetical protein U1E53_19855 [Dongiaceae bacterium]
MRRLLPAVALLLWLAAAPAAARSLAANGLSFSDELGGFTLERVSGKGTPDDPIVVEETVTGPQNPVLVVRGLDKAFGNLIGSQHGAGFAMRKIVTNRTDHRWLRYQVELRKELDQQSDYGDGLSFGQGATAGRTEGGAPFRGREDIDEPFDAIVFTDGEVPIGGTARLEFVVTDTLPGPVFYLLQEPLDQVAGSVGERRQLALRPAP